MISRGDFFNAYIVLMNDDQTYRDQKKGSCALPVEIISEV